MMASLTAIIWSGLFWTRTWDKYIMNRKSGYEAFDARFPLDRRAGRCGALNK
jgi:hypothetical protein